MTKTLQVRVDEELRTEADVVLREIGLDVPCADRIFLTKVVRPRGTPFELTAEPRAVEVEVDAGTQAKMDEIGALWGRRKPQKA